MCGSSPLLRRIERIRRAHEAVASLECAAPRAGAAARHLHSLIDQAAEDYALGQIPSPVAVETFGRVLQHVLCRQAPAIDLTRSGGIWAEWSETCHRNVAIFVGQDGRARLGAGLMVQETCRLPLLLEIEGDVEFIVSQLRTDPDLRWLRSPEYHESAGGGVL